MNWQVKYALANIAEQGQLTAEYVHGELIRIVTPDQPDVLAAISAANEIDAATAANYQQKYPDMDFLCGYRSACIWRGDAIKYLEDARVGWGSFGTLTSAALDGDANTASHKAYRFSDRLLRQYGPVRDVSREFDRIHRVALRSGTSLRIGMLADYEPTADAVRSLWADFGPLDIVWNINPNGNPSAEAIDAGRELGCEVMKWDQLKEHLRTA
ncbi:hypothetical protein [Chelatococcus reniformis]|uniref:Uncharacterized protein n=1 Tax=Chelatococcus reniformis TaxID=1494448 RepID=A0A916UX29_9HYPH|nr:hypothetical protein [Chelatococcus reniformis]GGC92610.1 hypothetical protein GCM10010994_58060 [Chelatococcus reniformis]